jgi:hypothetical protein
VAKPIDIATHTRALTADGSDNLVVTNELQVSTIDTTDSSAITVIPAATFNSDITVENNLQIKNNVVDASGQTLLPSTLGTANYVLKVNAAGTGAEWLASGDAGTVRTEEFPTVTNGSANVTMGSAYTLSQIDVYLNGARMRATIDYTVSSTTLTFSENLSTGDIVALYVYDTTENLITGNWSDLNDVSVSGASANAMVRYNGSAWVVGQTTEDSSGNLSVGGNATLTGDLTVSGGQIIMPTVATRDKYRLWDSSTYVIGMDNAISFGGLSDYAMTFQFSNNDARGFWFGDSTHTDAQGAMALTTNGKLTVAHSARIGYGEADTTTPGADHALDVNGSVSSTVGTNVRTFMATDGTQYVSLVSDLTSGGYNPISAAGDVGIIFSTDNDNTTDESGKGLVIAPWAQTAAKGIKIQEDGKVGVGTSSPSTELEVNGTITDDVSDVRTPRYSAFTSGSATNETITNEGVYNINTAAPTTTLTLGAPAVGTVMCIYNNKTTSVTLDAGSTITAMRKGADNDTTHNATLTLGANSITTITIVLSVRAIVTGTDVS